MSGLEMMRWERSSLMLASRSAEYRRRRPRHGDGARAERLVQSKEALVLILGQGLEGKQVESMIAGRFPKDSMRARL